MTKESVVGAHNATLIFQGIALAMDPSVGIPTIAVPIIAESERRRIVQSVTDTFKQNVIGGDTA